MEIGWLVALGTWLVDKFSGKREKSANNNVDAQNVTINFNECSFNKSSFPVIKETVKKMAGDISEEFKLPPDKAKEHQEIVDGSYSQESLVYSVGAITGSTATASGVPYKEVNQYVKEWWSSKYMLNCANCHSPHEFKKSTPDENYVCNKCGSDIFTIETKD